MIKQYIHKSLCVLSGQLVYTADLLYVIKYIIYIIIIFTNTKQMYICTFPLSAKKQIKPRKRENTAGKKTEIKSINNQRNI